MENYIKQKEINKNKIKPLQSKKGKTRYLHLMISWIIFSCLRHTDNWCLVV